MVKVEISNPAEVNGLLDAVSYDKVVRKKAN